MSFDAENIFSENQAISASAASQRVVRAGTNAGDGEPLFISLFVSESFEGAGSVSVSVQDAGAEDGPFATVQSSGGLPADSLKKGAVVHLGGLPPRTRPFLRLQYEVTGAVGTGTVSAALMANRQTNGV